MSTQVLFWDANPSQRWSDQASFTSTKMKLFLFSNDVSSKTVWPVSHPLLHYPVSRVCWLGQSVRILHWDCWDKTPTLPPLLAGSAPGLRFQLSSSGRWVTLLFLRSLPISFCTVWSLVLMNRRFLCVSPAPGWSLFTSLSKPPFSGLFTRLTGFVPPILPTRCVLNSSQSGILSAEEIKHPC